MPLTTPPAALIFDLDGTLIDSRRDITTAINRTREAYGLPPLTLEQIVVMVGEGASVLIERAFAPDLPADRLDEVLVRYLATYREVCLDETRPYPGVPEMLEVLAARYPLALLSNKGEELSRIILKGLRLDPYFQEILGGDTLTTRKPDPAGLHLLAERLSVPVQSLLMVGDTRIDHETARAAGCPFALVAWGFPRPIGTAGLMAEVRAETAAELTEALLEIPAR